MVAIFGIPMIIYQSGASIGVGISVGVVSVILNTAIYFSRIYSLFSASVCVFIVISSIYWDGNSCRPLKLKFH